MPKKSVEHLLKTLNITHTKNIKLYTEALTHNSYNNEKKVGYTYQKLEFLGDSIISKLISEFLFYQDKNEQEMTEIRKNLVNSDIFRKASDDLGLLDYAFIGKGVNLDKDTKNIKTDLFESIAGAIYLDKGEVKVWEYLKKTIIKYYESNLLVDAIDYKSRIQELLQSNIANKKQKKNHLYYNTIEINKNCFKAALVCNEIVYGTGIGKTKKEAQKNAAKQAYEKFAEPLNQKDEHLIIKNKKKLNSR